MIDKVYVTKYALTGGVRLGRVQKVWTGGASGRTYVDVNSCAYVLGKEAHVTHGGAVDEFERMRASAIKSAEKKLEKLRAMKFEVKE